jgi:hypothetical protein
VEDDGDRGVGLARLVEEADLALSRRMFSELRRVRGGGGSASGRSTGEGMGGGGEYGRSAGLAG